jgi:hypothetical protein
MTNPIPPITAPMGKSWQQPDSSTILIDDTHAVLTQEQLNQLLDYSRSMPSGVYVGKMWKRFDSHMQCWLLCWYESSYRSDHCSIQHRQILIA